MRRPSAVAMDDVAHIPSTDATMRPTLNKWATTPFGRRQRTAPALRGRETNRKKPASVRGASATMRKASSAGALQTTMARLAHAATLLHNTDAGLAEIAARAGYGSEFSFGKAFKRHFGVSPGAYRGQTDAPAVGTGTRVT